MKYFLVPAVVCLVLLPKGVSSFSPPASRATSRLPPPAVATSAATTTSTRLFGYNPIEDETPEERAARMELVRKLQQTFYKEGIADDDHQEHTQETQTGTGDADTRVELEGEATATTTPSTTVLRDLPLWRVQWRELPGSQNVLNVHVPHYTNMFQKILKGRTKPWGGFGRNATTGDSESGGASTMDGDHYFGHVFLDKGSENLDNPDHALQVGDEGVLMRISDARQIMDDGRLTLLVQALEKFRITRVVRSHSPYAVADVELVVDEEQVASAAGSEASPGHEAAARALACHPFEVRRVAMDECELARDASGRMGLSVSPLSNYDAGQAGGCAGSNDPPGEDADLVAIAERDAWLKLDELLRLLGVAARGEVGLPVPTQILGLLPKTSCALAPVAEREAGKSETNPIAIALEPRPWPGGFSLVGTADRMEAAETATVGTHSESPFVRVDAASYRSYPPLRRAQRFSYAVWTLIDSVDLDSAGGDGGEDPYGRARILEIGSTRERLALATEKMDRICALLQRIIRMHDGRGSGVRG